MLFFQKGKRKREKKKSRVQKTFVLKTTHKKSERVFNNNKTTTTKKKFLFRIFHHFNSSLARKKERKKDAFSSGELPESGTYSSYITTHTQRERDLSFFLSLNSFFVLLSFSSSAFCCFRRVSSLCIFVFVRELNRENGIGNGAAHALAHSLSETTNR